MTSLATKSKHKYVTGPMLSRELVYIDNNQRVNIIKLIINNDCVSTEWGADPFPAQPKSTHLEGSMLTPGTRVTQRPRNFKYYRTGQIDCHSL